MACFDKNVYEIELEHFFVLQIYSRYFQAIDLKIKWKNCYLFII